MGQLLNDLWDIESTHQEALCYAVASTTGPIVELGGGYYSTPLLHGLCEPTQRELWTIEGWEPWYENLNCWEAPWHHVIFDDEHRIPVEHPGVVFVDHDSGDIWLDEWNSMGQRKRLNRAGATRGQAISKAHESETDLVVVHDTQPEHAIFYPGMQEAIDEWRFTRTYKLPSPGAWTTICSDIRDFR